VTDTPENPNSGRDLVVIDAIKDWACTACGQPGDLMFMEDGGPVCMACADMDHLVYLPRGNAALSRRARKSSVLSAVVVRFSRSRRRYERQGILVERAALDAGEEACLADAEVRARRQVRDEERRAADDAEFEVAVAGAILGLFPACPTERATEIASHTGRRGSGRVGRSAAGRQLEPEAVTLAVVAAIRHGDTDYDDLLMAGVERGEARARVQADIDVLLRSWRAQGS
jgi:hypothetical protein